MSWNACIDVVIINFSDLLYYIVELRGKLIKEYIKLSWLKHIYTCVCMRYISISIIYIRGRFCSNLTPTLYC